VKKALHKVFDSDSDLRQSSIARATGIQQSSISRWTAGVTRHMGDDNWLKIYPYIQEFLPENYIPKDIHGKNRIFLTNKQNNIRLVGAKNNARMDRSVNDPMTALALKYFRELPSDAERLKIIAKMEEMVSDKTTE
jgi:hypothetical protein